MMTLFPQSVCRRSRVLRISDNDRDAAAGQVRRYSKSDPHCAAGDNRNL
jgi:hypothetical protein